MDLFLILSLSYLKRRLFSCVIKETYALLQKSARYQCIPTAEQAQLRWKRYPGGSINGNPAAPLTQAASPVWWGQGREWRVPYPTTCRMSSLNIRLERRARMSRNLPACHLDLLYSEDPWLQWWRRSFGSALTEKPTCSTGLQRNPLPSACKSWCSSWA